MESLEFKAFGKINLSLDVICEMENGYHAIDTIMQRVELHDNIAIEKTNTEKLEIICDNSQVPLDNTNLVYKGWELLKQYKTEDCGIKVTIDKRIPVAAGLAGGSSNVAYFMMGICELWDLELSKEKLMELGRTIGADVPYFFDGRTCRAKGIGDLLEPIGVLSGVDIVIVNNGKEISSKYVYDNIKMNKDGSLDDIVHNLQKNGLVSHELGVYNAMETVSIPLYPEIQKIKDMLMDNGATFSLMSGSGPTVFAVFKDTMTAQKAYDNIKTIYDKTFITKTM